LNNEILFGCVLTPTLQRMKFRLLIFLACFVPFRFYAQLNVVSGQASGNWADYYVQNILLGGGVTAFNISFLGDSNQIGEFTQTGTGLEMPYGLMLGTGDIALSVDTPNTSADQTLGGNTAFTDADLQTLSGQSIHDAAVLEFDFVPQGDTIRFKYVFASEEYNNYVCSINDVFGFFLSGPGISGSYTNGAENLAVLPGSGTVVGINTVNNGSGTWGTAPSACGSCPCNSEYFVDNTYPDVNPYIVYDGMTVVLEAVHSVICGDTYHIKLVIGDASDPILDSGVFLEGGSFKSNLIEINIASVNGDSTINEGCGEAQIKFARADTSDTSTSMINIIGTATNGVDFDLIPDTITLLPGVFDTVVIIHPFFDGLPEGVEYITIQAISVSVCGDTFISEGTLYFYDVPDLDIVTTPDTTFNCPPGTLDIVASVASGGPPPYTYLWNTGDSGAAITVPIVEEFGVDTFIVQVWDSCALFSMFDTVLVMKNFQAPPVLDIQNDTSVNCVGDPLMLKADIDFGTGPFHYAWSTGMNDTTSQVTVTVNGPMTVTLTITDSCGRVTTDTAELTIKVPASFEIEFPDTMIYCVGSVLEVEPVVSGGIVPYQYAWEAMNPTYGDDLHQEYMINHDTTLVFWVRDACGSEANEDFFIDAVVVDPLIASLSSEEARCSGAEFHLDPDVSGGLEPISYLWSTSDSDTAIVLFANTTQLIGLTVTDVCGHEDTASGLFVIPEYTPLHLLISGDEELCFGDEYFINAFASGGAGDYTYTWGWQQSPMSGEIFQKIDSNVFRVIPMQSNTHYITATDYCGNTVVDTLHLTLEHCLYIPNVITANGDGINDVFYIENITNFGDAHLYVYNRWGLKVYEAQPYLNDWDPSDKPAGTYFYILESNNFPELRGSLTVIKDR